MIGPDEPGRIASRFVFRGSLLDVRVDTVRYPDGSTGDLEIVRHRGAAAALPLLRAGERPEVGTGPAVVLLRQYRYAAGGFLWEVPAGKLDDGERPEDCARRELLEEAGIVAGGLRPLTTLLTTPGFTDERIDLFLATALEFVEPEREPHEFMEARILGFDTALEMVERGDITDGKTVVSLLLAARTLDRGGGKHG
ncbi:MAG: NUDIX hydrolase [Gemmatimonadota bacterium]